LRWSI